MSLERYHDQPMHCTTTGKARASITICHYESKECQVVETDRKGDARRQSRKRERKTNREKGSRQADREKERK